MPQLPIPPPMTLAQRLQTIQQISGNTSNPNIYQQAILDAVEVKRIALEQAQKVLQEYMEQEQQKRKTTLTIENIDKIVGSDYNDSLRVAGVKEWDTHYEFTLIYAHHNTIETILLHRKRTSDERYVMEYKGQTLWVTKDRLSTIDGILECMREV